MPVPKGKQAAYGQIVGANINRGKSLEAAKDIADRAMKHVSPTEARKAQKRCKACGKSHGSEGH